jgi:hypothetical protein
MNSENSTSCRLRTSLGGTWMDLSQQAGSTITLIIRNICTDVNQVVYLGFVCWKASRFPFAMLRWQKLVMSFSSTQDVQRSVVVYLLS